MGFEVFKVENKFESVLVAFLYFVVVAKLVVHTGGRNSSKVQEIHDGMKIFGFQAE